ncbi:MAG TPA: FAD-binding protein [Solirubrobacteraceae bacterium]|jgi:fumarate reductase flavoprotein subunit
MSATPQSRDGMGVREAPVVVVGAGAGGMMAALTLRRAGLQPLLVEKSFARKSNTALGGGLVQAAGTRLQRELGIVDTPAAMKADIMAKNHGQASEAVVEAICEHSREVVEILTDLVGLQLHLDTAVRFVGHSEYRMHAAPGETGAEIAAALREHVVAALGAGLLDETPAQRLLVRDGSVLGVEVEHEGQPLAIRSRYVILACNGFAGDRELLRRHVPEMVDALYIGSPNSTGEAVRWGVELGAALDRMQAYQGHAHVNPGSGTRLGGGLPSLGSIVVNRDGRRFAREDQGYSEYAGEVLSQPGGSAVEIFDEAAYEAARAAGSFRAAEQAGEVQRAGSVAELAERFELPHEALAEEIASYNAGARVGQDRLGRVGWLQPLEPPLYAARITGALVHTQGGLRIDAHCRVLRQDDSPIHGLFAVGGAAAGMSGEDASGYLSGNGLIHALATGLIAARHVAWLLGSGPLGSTGLGSPSSDAVLEAIEHTPREKTNPTPLDGGTPR